MSGRRKGAKVQVHGAKPEPPPFIARMREQIVANENADRSEKRRRERPSNSEQHDHEDEPRVVKLNSDDLSEEEYKRMKLDLETKYRLDSTEPSKSNAEELDIDALIQGRSGKRSNKSSGGAAAAASSSARPRDELKSKGKNSSGKLLSYGSSSSEEDDNV